MTPLADVTLVAQRQTLRERMLAQRQAIAEQMDAAPEVNNGFPRSKTMRFLTGRPGGLALALLTEFAALVVGARYFRSMTAVRAVARIVRSATIARDHHS
jgi:hypothetical protein